MNISNCNSFVFWSVRCVHWIWIVAFCSCRAVWRVEEHQADAEALANAHLSKIASVIERLKLSSWLNCRHSNRISNYLRKVFEFFFVGMFVFRYFDHFEAMLIFSVDTSEMALNIRLQWIWCSFSLALFMVVKLKWFTRKSLHCLLRYLNSGHQKINNGKTSNEKRRKVGCERNRGREREEEKKRMFTIEVVRNEVNNWHCKKDCAV